MNGMKSALWCLYIGEASMMTTYAHINRLDLGCKDRLQKPEFRFRNLRNGKKNQPLIDLI